MADFRSSDSPSFEMALIEDNASIKRRKRKRWKKPADHPKRPLSAYNLFFQWGRERLLSGESLSPLKQEDVDQIDVDTSRHSKRRHRREHGVIGFTELAKMLGTKWKELEPEYKEMFKKRAEVEKTRYDKAVSVYKSEKSLEDDVKVPSDTKQQKIKPNKKQANNLFPKATKAKQQLTLREDVETIQPLSYGATVTMQRPGVPFSVEDNQMRLPQSDQGVYHTFYRSHCPLQYVEQHGVFQSENQIRHLSPHSTESNFLNHMVDVKSNYMPQPINHVNYLQSNSAARLSSSIHNDSLGMNQITDMRYDAMWNRGSVPSMSAQTVLSSFHSPPDQVYSNANYLSPSSHPLPNVHLHGEQSTHARYWPLAASSTLSNHNHVTPQFGNTATDSHSIMGMQPQSMHGHISQLPGSFPLQSVESFSSHTPTTGSQQTIYQGIRDDADGLSTTSSLNFFES